MEERPLNESESLELITRMIKNTQQKLEKVHSLPYLVFGYTTAVISVAVWYMLSTTHNPLWNLLWMLIPVFGFSILNFVNRKSQPMIRTFVDKAIDYVWYVCGAAVAAASFTPTLWKHVPILFIVAFVISIATTITGLITKVKLMVVSGGIAILLSLILPSVKGFNAILYFGAIFIIMQVIPGHILYFKGKKYHV